MKDFIRKTLGVILAITMVLSVFGGIPLTLRASGADVGESIEYGAYPQSRVTDEALIAADGKAQDGESDAASRLIDDAKEAIDALEYDENKTPEENKAAVDKILDKLDEDLAAQRAEDQLSEDKEAFDDYKADAKDEADGKAQDGDSDAASRLIDDAKEAIDALEYDEDKTPEENKAAVDDILDKLDGDLAAQRAADAAAQNEDGKTETDACRLCGEYHNAGTLNGFITGFLHDLIYIIKRLVSFFGYEILLF